MNRREFISAAALLPPALPGIKPILRSPKDAEHVASLRKAQSVSVHVAPRPPAGRFAATLPGGVTELSISLNGAVATIAWQNGHAPFVVERKDSLDGPWEATGNATMARSVALPVMGDRGYFRIRESVPMPLVGEVQPDGLHLSWTPPDF